MHPRSHRPPQLATLLLLVLQLSPLLPTAAQQRTSQQVPAQQLRGRVVAVTDGDTLRLLVDRQEVRVRLHGIDAPEARQPFGTRAKQQLSDLCFGKDVTVTVRDRDRYGRVVGEVWLGRDSVNAAMVAHGLAWAYRRYSTEYVPLEERARRERRGLWSDANPVAPWEFRPSRSRSRR